MKPEQERLRNLVSDTVTLLCRNGLAFQDELKIEGLIGITLDNNEVFLVPINKKFHGSGLEQAGGLPLDSDVENSELDRSGKSQGSEESSTNGKNIRSEHKTALFVKETESKPEPVISEDSSVGIKQEVFDEDEDVVFVTKEEKLSLHGSEEHRVPPLHGSSNDFQIQSSSVPDSFSQFNISSGERPAKRRASQMSSDSFNVGRSVHMSPAASPWPSPGMTADMTSQMTESQLSLDASAGCSSWGGGNSSGQLDASQAEQLLDQGDSELETTQQLALHNLESEDVQNESLNTRSKVDRVKRQLWKVRIFKETVESLNKSPCDEGQLTEGNRSSDVLNTSVNDNIDKSSNDTKDSDITNSQKSRGTCERQPQRKRQSKKSLTTREFDANGADKNGPWNFLPTSQAMKDKGFKEPIRLMLSLLTKHKLNVTTMRVSWRPSGGKLEETWKQINGLRDQSDLVVASNHQVAMYISSLNGTYTRPSSMKAVKHRPDVYPMISYLIVHKGKLFDMDLLQNNLKENLPNCHAAPIRKFSYVPKSQLEDAVRLICKDHKNSFVNTMLKQSLGEIGDGSCGSSWKVTHVGVVNESVSNDMKPVEEAFKSLTINTTYWCHMLGSTKRKLQKCKPNRANKPVSKSTCSPFDKGHKGMKCEFSLSKLPSNNPTLKEDPDFRDATNFINIPASTENSIIQGTDIPSDRSYLSFNETSSGTTDLEDRSQKIDVVPSLPESPAFVTSAEEYRLSHINENDDSGNGNVKGKRKLPKVKPSKKKSLQAVCERKVTRKSPRTKVAKKCCKAKSISKQYSASLRKLGHKKQASRKKTVTVSPLKDSSVNIKQHGKAQVWEDSALFSIARATPAGAIKSDQKKRKRKSSNLDKTGKEQPGKDCKKLRLSKQKKKHGSKKDIKVETLPNSENNDLAIPSQEDRKGLKSNVTVRTRIISLSNYPEMMIKARSRHQGKVKTKNPVVLVTDISHQYDKKLTSSEKKDCKVLVDGTLLSNITDKDMHDTSNESSAIQKTDSLSISPVTSEQLSNHGKSIPTNIGEAHNQQKLSTPVKQAFSKILGTCTPVKLVVHEEESPSKNKLKSISPVMSDINQTSVTTEIISRRSTSSTSNIDTHDCKPGGRFSPTTPVKSGDVVHSVIGNPLTSKKHLSTYVYGRELDVYQNPSSPRTVGSPVTKSGSWDVPAEPYVEWSGLSQMVHTAANKIESGGEPGNTKSLDVSVSDEPEVDVAFEFMFDDCSSHGKSDDSNPCNENHADDCQEVVSSVSDSNCSVLSSHMDHISQEAELFEHQTKDTGGAAGSEETSNTNPCLSEAKDEDFTPSLSGPVEQVSYESEAAELDESLYDVGLSSQQSIQCDDLENHGTAPSEANFRPMDNNLISHTFINDDKDSTTTFSGPEDSFSLDQEDLDSFESRKHCDSPTHESDDLPCGDNSATIPASSHESSISAEDIINNSNEPDDSHSEFSFRSDSSDREERCGSYQDNEMDSDG